MCEMVNKVLVSLIPANSQRLSRPKPFGHYIPHLSKSAETRQHVIAYYQSTCSEGGKSSFFSTFR